MEDKKLVEALIQLEEKLKEALESPNVKKIKEIQKEKANLIRSLKQTLVNEMEEKQQKKSREIRIGDTIYWVELAIKEKLDEQAVKEYLAKQNVIQNFLKFEKEYKLKKKKI